MIQSARSNITELYGLDTESSDTESLKKINELIEDDNFVYRIADREMAVTALSFKLLATLWNFDD